MLAQHYKGPEHLVVGIVGVAPTGIGQQKNRSTGESCIGKAESEGACATCLRWKDHPKSRDAQEGDGLRLEPFDLLVERGKACSIFFWTEGIDPGTCSANDVGESQPPFRETPILQIREREVNQAGLVEKFPETV